MNKTTSLVIVGYNNLPLFKKCYESAIEMSSDDVEIIVVDNRSPDQGTIDFINNIKKNNKNIKVLGTGKNIGCTEGFNLGFKHATGKYLVKLDDDTIIKTKNWDKKIVNIFKQSKSNTIAFIAPRSNVEQVSEICNTDIKNFKHVKTNIIGFSMVMIPRWFYEEFGEFKSLNPMGDKIDSLYGGEELHYARIVYQNNKYMGYADNVKIFHLANEDRDLEYVLWKMWYGYYGETKLPYEEFKKDKNELTRAFKRWTTDENEWRRSKAKEWLSKNNI